MPRKPKQDKQFIQATSSRQPFTWLLDLVEDLTEADGRVVEQYLEDVLAEVCSTKGKTNDGGSLNATDGAEWSKEMGKGELARVLGMSISTLRRRVRRGELIIHEVSSKIVKVPLSVLPEEARKRWS